MATSPSRPVPTLAQLIAPTERQREFIRAFFEKDYVLYGGAAGGGKSYILRWVLVLYLVWLFNEFGLRNVQVGLFCEDYPSLLDRQISKMRFEFPEWLGTLREGSTGRNFTLRPEYGGGTVALRNLDDPSKYLSAEFAAIGIDELTRNEIKVFDFLRSRCRWPGVERPKVAAASNPGGPGHKWVKKLWIEGDFTDHPNLLSVKNQFAFIPAKASDNPHLPKSYHEKLKTLPPEMAKAYAEGDWNLFAGQYFDVFSTTTTVSTTKQLGMQSWWPAWLSGDWGFEHDAAFYWHRSGRFSGKVIDKDGNEIKVSTTAHITYREMVERRLTPAELAHRIVERSEGETLEAFYLSPDAFANREGRSSIAQQMGEILHTPQGSKCPFCHDVHRFPYPAMANDDRIGGWMLWYGLMQRREWFVDPSCRKLIETIPSLVRDEDNLEDILKAPGDDPADSVRYGLYSRLHAKSMAPLNVRIAERVTSVDPTIRAIQAKKATIEESKKGRGIVVPVSGRNFARVRAWSPGRS